MAWYKGRQIILAIVLGVLLIVFLINGIVKIAGKYRGKKGKTSLKRKNKRRR
jgi:uncharacterized iron-regulated membrane protein